jgi:hypothetical protein
VQMKGGRRGTRRQNATPPTLWARASHGAMECIQEMQTRRKKPEEPSGPIDTRQTQSRVDGRQSQNSKLTLMNAWANHEWKKRWVRTADGSTAATWNTPWVSPLTLYDNLPKHQTTTLMLLRTEVIGLTAWPASIRVPDILPRCDCGWHMCTDCPP